MKIKIRCFKVLLWPKKNHRSTIKICRLQIWKKRCTIDGNLNMYHIWQSKAMNFSEIFQEAAGDRTVVLVVLYCFMGSKIISWTFLSSLHGTRKNPPWVNPPRWIPPDQVPPNLTLTQTLTLTDAGIRRGWIDQGGIFRTPFTRWN